MQVKLPPLMMVPETLRAMGWSAIHQAHWDDRPEFPGVRPARVVRQDRGRALVHDGERAFAARLALGEGATDPAVGDWVAIRDDAAEGIGPRVLDVLPRTTALGRRRPGRSTEEQVVAANVDVAFIVVGLDNDFNPRRIERYVALVRGAGVTPVLVLTKADTCPDVPARLAAAADVASGIELVPVATPLGHGIPQVRALVPAGATAVVIGSSGAGKSTLLNRLLGDVVVPVGDVRAHDSHGRHTTTNRELFALPGGGMMIDTPGMRELALSADDDEGIRQAFGDIEALAATCRFPDCGHGTEPDCAVREALDSGALSVDRFANYGKLQRELAHLQRKRGAAPRHEERRAGRDFAKIIRDAKAAKNRSRR